MPQSLIVDLGMMLMADPPSTRMRLTFCSLVYLVTNKG